ncbi:hypothetical protein D3C75_1167870 [compost metagenome]
MVSGLSVTGLVLGIQAMVVKPPLAAERVPVAMVSLCSKPGSRRCVCMSMKPGDTSLPPASITPSPAPGPLHSPAAASSTLEITPCSM